MNSHAGEQSIPGARKKAAALLIARGLCAEPSGSDDDPYCRAVFQRVHGAPDTGLALTVDLDQIGAADEEIKTRLRQALTEYAKQHGLAASRLSFPGLGTWRIERGSKAAELPLFNKIALVTGAAGAIGAGICRGLLEKGCRVAASDISSEALADLVAELRPVGGERIIGVQMDVTDAGSVAAGFEETVFEWGGIDIVVANAGIAMVAALVDLGLEEFRRLEKVNVEGTLLTLAEAGRCLCRQGLGGDIVLVSTKNVFAPGAQFGAYSATKAASHQLARIASLEFAPFGVRVNMVAPDAVFSGGKRKSGLWAAIGPSRMRARGLDEKGLEEYYRNRNLLKARVTPAHVANAVLFFVTRQTPTTGATLPVDGGLPDATPR